jgi:hypothetical protein
MGRARVGRVFGAVVLMAATTAGVSPAVMAAARPVAASLGVGGSSAPPGTPAAPSTPADAPITAPVGPIATSPLGSGSFGGIATDPVHDHVFVSSNSTGTIQVFDYSGNPITTITGEPGAGAMLVDGSTLYVVLRSGGEIDRINTATLAETSVLATAINTPESLVKADGYLWTATCPGGSGGQLIRINMSTGATTPYASVNSYCPFITPDPANSNVFLTADYGLSSTSVTELTVASGAPVEVAYEYTGEIDNAGQFAVSPDGATFYTASGAPYGIQQWKMSDLSPLGETYVENPYPTSVTATGNDGGLIAGGMDGIYDPDVDTFDLHSPLAPHLSFDFESTDDTVPAGGLLFSPDGSRLFSASPGGFRVFAMPGVSGTVTNSASTPLSGVMVTALTPTGTVLGSATSDASGYYSIPRSDFSAGQAYQLRFVASGQPTAWYATTGAVATASAAATFNFDPDNGQPADLQLQAAGIFTGHLSDGHAVALAGLVVSFEQGGVVVATATTTSSGSFASPLLVPGIYTLAIDDPTWTSSSHTAGHIPEWFGAFGVERTGSGPRQLVGPGQAVSLGSQMVASFACQSADFVAAADLHGADLSACDLTHADLAGADLAGVDLTRSVAATTNLTGADLSGANFSQATLLLARMGGTTLTGATWFNTICPDGVSSGGAGGTCVGNLENPVPGDGSPIGALTATTLASGSTTVAGWTLDPDTTNPITVAVSLDGSPLTTGLADLAVPATPNTYPIYGPDHGFSLHLGSLGPGVHEVCVTAQNVDLGSDQALGCGSVDDGLGATTFHALQPARVLDTRDGTGAPQAPLGANQQLSLKVDGVGGVPSAHVGAVVLNVTVVHPTASSFLTLWPHDLPRPTASNVNFTAGQVVPNQVIVEVGANGTVDLYNLAGSTDVVADVSGWFDDGTVAGGAHYHALAPARLLDTRSGVGTPAGALGAGQSLGVQVAGAGGVPIGHVSAVVLNVTVTGATASSYLTAWPSGSPRPVASNLNWSAGQTVANLVVVPVSDSGWVSFYNYSGSVQVVADVQGWFDDGTVAGGASYHPISPNRVLDTRAGLGSAQQPLFPGETVNVRVGATTGVPASGVVAVVMNTTVTDTTASGYLTLWPTGLGQPLASDINWPAGGTVANLTVPTVSADGWLSVFNYAGATDVVGDVAGWFG